MASISARPPSSDFSPYTYYVRFVGEDHALEVRRDDPRSLEQRTLGSVVYINGIDTRPDIAQSTAGILSRKLHSIWIVLFNNPMTRAGTRAITDDGQRINPHDIPMSFIGLITNEIALSPVTIYAHSHGANVTSTALLQMRREGVAMERPIHVKAFGPATLVKNIESENVQAINYVHKHDLVSIGANMRIDRFSIENVLTVCLVARDEILNHFFPALPPEQDRAQLLQGLELFLLELLSPETLQLISGTILSPEFLRIAQTAFRSRFPLTNDEDMQRTSDALYKALIRHSHLQHILDTLNQQLVTQIPAGTDGFTVLFATLSSMVLGIGAAETISGQNPGLVPDEAYKIKIIGLQDRKGDEETDELFLLRSHSIDSYLQNDVVNADLFPLSES